MAGIRTSLDPKTGRLRVSLGETDPRGVIDVSKDSLHNLIQPPQPPAPVAPPSYRLDKVNPIGIEGVNKDRLIPPAPLPSPKIDNTKDLLGPPAKVNSVSDYFSGPKQLDDIPSGDPSAKEFYLPGEPRPEGEYNYEDRKIDGKNRLVAIPVAPTPDPKKQEEITSGPSLMPKLGYDPDTGQFGVGVAPIYAPPEKPKLAKTPDKVKATIDTLNVVSPVAGAFGLNDEVAKGVYEGNLYNEKSDLGLELVKTKKELDATSLEDTQKRKELADKYTQITGRLAENDKELNESQQDFVSLDDMGKNLSKGNILGLTRDITGGLARVTSQLAPTLIQKAAVPMAEGAVAGADLGLAVGGPAGALAGAGLGARTGYFMGMWNFTAGRNLADQYLSTLNEDGKTVGDTPDEVRAYSYGAIEPAVDLFLGEMGHAVIKKLAIPARYFDKKAASSLALNTVGLLSSSYAEEFTQQYAQEGGSTPNLGVFDLISDPQRFQDANNAGLIGAILLGAPGIAVGGAKGIHSYLSKDKTTSLPTPPKKGEPPSKVAPVVLGALDSTPVDTTSLKTPKTAPVEKVAKAVGEVGKPSDLKKEAPKVVKPEPLPTEDDIKAAFPNAAITINPEDVTPWNLYQKHAKEFSATYAELDKPASSYEELYDQAMESGVDLDAIYTAAADQGRTEKETNLLAQGLVQSQRQINALQNFTSDPDTHAMFSEAVEASKATPERVAKVDKVLEHDPSVSEDLVHSLGDKELDALTEGVPAKEPEDTRGKGQQYHGARSEVDPSKFDEGYYNNANIYGAYNLYTTDAHDIASGYKRKNSSGKIYAVNEKEPVSMFDMEAPIAVGNDPINLFASVGLKPGYEPSPLEELAFDEANKNGKITLRDYFDEIRKSSEGEGYSRDDVQEIFQVYHDALRESGFGGASHLGGVLTGKKPHLVKMYYDPKNQIELKDASAPIRIALTKANEEAKVASDKIVNTNSPDDTQASTSPDNAKAVYENQAKADPSGVSYELNNTDPEFKALGDKLGSVFDMLAERVWGKKESPNIKNKIRDSISQESRITEEAESPITGEKIPLTYLEKNDLDGLHARDYVNKKSAINVAIGIVTDAMRNEDRKIMTPGEYNGVMRTYLHELFHSVDFGDLLSNTHNNTLYRAVPSITKALMKQGNLDKEFLDVLPPSEVLAYGFEEYAMSSNSEAARELRKEFGLMQENTHSPFATDNMVLNSFYSKATKFLHDLLKAIKKMAGFDSDYKPIFDRIMKGTYGKIADTDEGNTAVKTRQERILNDRLKAGVAVRPSANLQAKILGNQWERIQNNGYSASIRQAAKEYTEPETPINEALRRAKNISDDRPIGMNALTDIIKDNNKWGFTTKLGTYASWFRSLDSFARDDRDGAHTQNLLHSYDNDKHAFLAANEKAIKTMKALPDFEKKFSLALELRAAESRNELFMNDDGSMDYYDRDGNFYGVDKATADDIKLMSQTFSLPLRTQALIARNKLEDFKGLTGFHDLPVDGDYATQKAWMKAFEDEAKEAKSLGLVSKKDMIAYARVKELMNTIEQYESTAGTGRIYVPEVRHGRWASEVYRLGEDGEKEVIGFETFDHPFHEPNVQTREAFKKKLAEKYKGRNVTISDVYHLTRNEIGKELRVGKDKVMLLADLMSSIAGLEPHEMDEVVRGADNFINKNSFSRHLIKSKHLEGASTDANFVTDTFFAQQANAAARSKWSDILHTTMQAYKKEAASDTPLGRKYARLYNDLDTGFNNKTGATENTIRAFTFFFGLAGNPTTAALQYANLADSAPVAFKVAGSSPIHAATSFKDALKYAAMLPLHQLSEFGKRIKTGDKVNHVPDNMTFDRSVLKSVFSKMFTKGNPEGLEAALDAVERSHESLSPTQASEAQFLRQINAPTKARNIWQGLKQKGSRALKVAQTAGGYMMTHTERSARLGMFFKMFELLHGNETKTAIALENLKNNKLFQEYRKFHPKVGDVEAIANFLVQEAFGRPQAALRPRFTRGALGASMFAFRAIPHKLLERKIDGLVRPKSRAELTGSLIGLATMAALTGFVGTTLGMSKLLDKALELWRDEDTPGEVQMKALLIQYLGGKELAHMLGISEQRMGDIMQRGLLTEIGAGTLSQRIALEPFFSDFAMLGLKAAGGQMPYATDFASFGGSFLAGAANAANQTAQGRGTFMSNWSPILPASIRNPLRAATMGKDDPVLSSKGKVIGKGSDYTSIDRLAQAFGIQPEKTHQLQLRNRMDQMRRSTNESIKKETRTTIINLLNDYEKTGDYSKKTEARLQQEALFKELESRGEVMTNAQKRAWIRSIYKDINPDPDSTEGLTKGQVKGRDYLERMYNDEPGN